MPSEINEICKMIEKRLKFQPNNCLINLYPDGKSKMGFHSDQIDILSVNTGVAIVSIGEERRLRFRQIEDKEIKYDFSLGNGSLLYMTQQVQKEWHHAIPKDDTSNPRLSLTFRSIKEV